MRCSTDLALRFVVCGFLSGLLGTTLVATAGEARAEKAIKETKVLKIDPTQTIDQSCTRHELKIWALIEKHENEELQASSMLVDVAGLLQDAQSICARGDIQSALTIYRSALQDLTNHLREIDIQSAD